MTASATSTVSIRPVTEPDWPTLVDLEEACFGESSFSPYFLRMVPILFSHGCLLAERDEDRVALGYVLGAHVQGDPTEAWILSLGVRPEAAGRGLGNRLSRAAMTALATAGARRVWLTVAPDNHPARRIYARLGFELDRTDPSFFGPGRERLVLRATL